MNPTFITINNPLAVGGTYADSAGINDLGAIVGTYLDSNSVAQGFLDIDGNFTTLTDPTAGTDGTYAFGISDFGEIVGSFETFSPPQASRKTAMCIWAVPTRRSVIL
jgi:uncharacterized membrane protein